jgi:protein involved in polysaccharide export with SLBB domain
MTRAVGAVIGLALAASVGCRASAWTHADPQPPQRSSLETVAAPDVVRIDAPRLVPLPMHRVEPEDALFVVANGTSDGKPINGVYPVGPDGAIDLGPTYGGPMTVSGMTASEVEDALTERLTDLASEPAVSVCLARARGADAVPGEHLVRPDGTIRLGPYGSVPVAGKTLPEVAAAVESHLRRYLDRPEVRVSVSAANSKAVAGQNATSGRGPETTGE